MLVGILLLASVKSFSAPGVLLSWNQSPDTNVVGYKIYYGSASKKYSATIDAGSATNVVISGLLDGSTNYFSAKAYGASTNESDFCEEVMFIATNVVSVVVSNPPPPSPPPVTNPPPAIAKLLNVTVNSNALDAAGIVLIWDATANTQVVGYQIFWGSRSGNYQTVTNWGLTNGAAFSGLTAGSTNFFAVRAYDAQWNTGPMSDEAVWVQPFPPAPTPTPESPKTEVAVNAAPTLDLIGDLTVNLNSPWRSVLLTGISDGSATENQSLQIRAVSMNTNLIAQIRLAYTNGNNSAVLSFLPVSKKLGTATINVTVNDGSSTNGTTTRSFVVTVADLAKLAALPRFSKQLDGTTVLTGKPVSLKVGVIGKAPFKYQWKLNGKNIPGATAPTLSIKSAQKSNAGVYSVTVANSAGVTNSFPAALKVVPSPAPSMSAPITTGETFSFEVAGVTGYSYVVEASSDLQTWTAVQTNIAPFTFTDAKAASLGQRFYRSYYRP